MAVVLIVRSSENIGAYTVNEIRISEREKNHLRAGVLVCDENGNQCIDVKGKQACTHNRHRYIVISFFLRLEKS